MGSPTCPLSNDGSHQLGATESVTVGNQPGWYRCCTKCGATVFIPAPAKRPA